MNSKRITGIVILALIIVGIIVFALKKEGLQINNSSVVATVNSTQITQDELEESIEVIQGTYQQRGEDITDLDVLKRIEGEAINNLVNNRLLLASATEQGFEASEEEVDQDYASITATFIDEQAFLDRIDEVGISKERFLKDLKNEITIRNLFNSIILEEAITVTQEEVQARYDDVVSQNVGTELPPLEDVQDDIQTQLQIEKENVFVNQFIEDLRSAAEIEILI